ncbi:MAG: glycosyltransferase family 25 protein [Limisphaerales bacterium]
MSSFRPASRTMATHARLAGRSGLPAHRGRGRKNARGTGANRLSRPRSYETLDRYNRGCVLSHRAAWQEFLAGPDSYCCILEDDIYISDDFPKFVKDSAWIPKNCKLLKIETIEQPVIISRKTTTCLNRTSAFLYSLDFGTAAYIVSREGAQILLNETARPRFAIDIIVYSKNGRRKLKPSLLFPALCIQAKRHKAGEGNYFC